ncbi:MAG: hypothetical protein ABIJ00_07740, partial [Candidatus Eisenbacteria bacterium]
MHATTRTGERRNSRIQSLIIIKRHLQSIPREISLWYALVYHQPKEVPYGIIRWIGCSFKQHPY